MIRWVQLGTASVPDGGELRLMQRGSEFTIFAGTAELMGSRLSGSEEALASLACARLIRRPSPHILIGGLGMGFTLRTALAALGPDARITIAELVPEILAWARGPLAGIHGESLDDPRVTIFKGDVGDLIADARASYDAILLDVDNGPEGLMRTANDDLYDTYGLREARDALRPEGILAVWSAAPHEVFAQRLRHMGFTVEEHRVRANGRKSGPRHIVWLATNRGPDAQPRPGFVSDPDQSVRSPSAHPRRRRSSKRTRRRANV
jgi:spermidine synthase